MSAWALRTVDLESLLIFSAHVWAGWDELINKTFLILLLGAWQAWLGWLDKVSWLAKLAIKIHNFLFKIILYFGFGRPGWAGLTSWAAHIFSSRTMEPREHDSTYKCLPGIEIGSFRGASGAPGA